MRRGKEFDALPAAEKQDLANSAFAMVVLDDLAQCGFAEPANLVDRDQAMALVRRAVAAGVRIDLRAAARAARRFAIEMGSPPKNAAGLEALVLKVGPVTLLKVQADHS